MPASSSARMTSIRRVPSTTGIGDDRGVVVERRRVRRERARRVGDRVAARRRDRDRDVDAVVADPRLQLVGRAVRDGAAVVEHDDVVGQLVGLLEVLRGEDDRGAVAHEVAQHLPQVAAAARVEARWSARRGTAPSARRRGWRRGRAGGACRRSRSSPAGRRRRRGRGARAARRRGARASPLRRGGGAGRPSRGSSARSSARRRVACCAATPMRSRTRVGVVDDVEAGDAWPCPSVGAESVVRMRIAVVLPAPLWPSRPRTVPGRDVEVEVAQRPEVAEALAEAAAVTRPRPGGPRRSSDCSYGVRCLRT